MLAAGLGAGLATMGAAEARPAVLTADQMRAFGLEALAKGYADQALDIATALALRDAADSGAFVLKAQALRVLHRLPDSEAAARQAWSLARDQGARYQAATSVAQALSLQGHRTAAQYWLRQAVQNAPSGAAQAQALQDFNYVRAQNPLRLQVSASVRPSDNVNGGARDPLFDYHGIPFILSGDALALSGLAYGLGVSGSYKLGETATAERFLTFGASQQGVVLSEAARAQAPKAQNGDYGLSHLELGLQRKAVGSFGALTSELTAGHTWYAGENLSNSLEASVELGRPVGSALGTIGGSLTRQIRLDRSLSSSTEAEISAHLSKAGAKGDTWLGNLSLSRIVSGDIGIDHAEASLGLGWQGSHPVAGVSLGAAISVRVSDYAASPYRALGRQDVHWQASVQATVNKMTYLGFAPVLSLDVARNDSNVALYDTQTLGLSLSIASRF